MPILISKKAKQELNMPEQHRHRKRFGQNFLHDANLLHKIIHFINPQAHEHVIEIGPGQGALTQFLANKVNRLDLIEIDRDLVAYLQQRFNHENINIHQADVLKFNFTQILPQTGKVRVIGNLPYNISTPILFKLLNHAEKIADMHFLLQQEVVDRMTATPGNKQYGRLSIMTQYFCEATPAIKVPATAFIPQPKVQSRTVHLTPHPTPKYQAHDFEHFKNIVKTAFSSRRKTIHNGLKKIIHTQDLQQINISPRCRPEELSVAQFVRISNEIKVL
jgi:16S rRNA (adenine1518-N6/adenine1519-N6)-dimethyltransferase